MKKTYILDTNVLLSDGNSLFGFEEHDLVLPLIVLEELDRHKDRQDEVGRNAREVVRKLADLTKIEKDFKAGIPLGKNLGILRILSIEDIWTNGTPLEKLPVEMQEKKSGDNTIAQFCVNYAAKYKDQVIALVTRDTILRLKAQALGVVCEDYRKFNVATSASTLYSGVATIERDDVVVADFYSKEEFFLPQEVESGLVPNQFVIMKNGQQSAVGRFNGKGEPLSKIQKHTSKLIPRNKEQEFATDLLFDPDIKLITLSGKAGTGKAQPLDAKILTPTGWTTMGKISVGDYVISKDGKPTKVTGVFPQGQKKIYKITTTDNTATECCEDHLWFTETFENKKRNKSGSVKSTKEIIETLYRDKNGSISPNHFIPRNNEIEFKSSSLPLDPYTLGVLIGDGCLKNNISIASTKNDSHEIIGRVKSELIKLNCSITHPKKDNDINYHISFDADNKKTAKKIRITDVLTGKSKTYERIGTALSDFTDIKRGTLHYRCMFNKTVNGKTYEFLPKENRWQHPIKNILTDLNLLNKKSYEKFIPPQYLYASTIEDRLSLLKGLMDTDGSIKKNGEASYTTTSEQLSKDVKSLVQSLGGRAVIKKRDRRGKKSMMGDREIISNHCTYEFNISLPEKFNPFHLSRKADRWKSAYMHRVGIAKIEFIGVKEAQCIMVDNPEHLYITDEYIVTHNTLTSINAGLEQILNQKRYNSLVICRPVMPVGKDVGFLPGTLDEKLEPWLAPIKDNLRFLLGTNKPPTAAVGGRKGKMEEKGGKNKFDEQILQSYFEDGIIEVQALTFIRGRSIANAFIIIDEAQNTSLHEIKTILTRVGENTKIVLCGDVEQIDNTYIDSVSNGLSIVIERFKNEKIAAHVTFTKGERSLLATLASEILQ